MSVQLFSRRGDVHRLQGVENQDAVRYVENEEVLAVILADGASGCERGREGAQMACEAAGKLVLEMGSELFGMLAHRVARMFWLQIRWWINRHRDPEVDVHEYGSTFCMALIDRRSGRTLVLNLGDGALIRVRGTGSRTVLRPRHYGSGPVLTTTDGGERAMEVKALYLQEGESLVLCSDGLLELRHSTDILEKLVQMDFAGMEKCMREAKSADDCSYIAVTA